MKLSARYYEASKYSNLTEEDTGYLTGHIGHYVWVLFPKSYQEAAKLTDEEMMTLILRYSDIE